MPCTMPKLFGAVLMSSVIVVGGCTEKQRSRPVEVSARESRSVGRISASNTTVRVEFDAARDRFTFFGPSYSPVGHAEPPNMLHLVGLERTPPANGDYTFFGGAYSWFAPQNGERGWKDANGKTSPWPPDPLMDVGPAVLSASSARAFSVMGPVQRSGLREEKSLTITGPWTAELTYTLHNTTGKAVLAGPWLNAAVAPIGSVLAFRVGTDGNSRTFERWGGMGENAAARFGEALSPASASGWATLPLSSAKWDDGIKVYLDSGESFAEIAVWRDGWWFHRRLLSGDGATNRRLRELGEGPVACYINPGLGIIEAELVAPIVDIPAKGKTTATERWTLIESATADVGALPR